MHGHCEKSTFAGDALSDASALSTCAVLLSGVSPPVLAAVTTALKSWAHAADPILVAVVAHGGAWRPKAGGGLKASGACGMVRLATASGGGSGGGSTLCGGAPGGGLGGHALALAAEGRVAVKGLLQIS